MPVTICTFFELVAPEDIGIYVNEVMCIGCRRLSESLGSYRRYVSKENVICRLYGKAYIFSSPNLAWKEIISPFPLL